MEKFTDGFGRKLLVHDKKDCKGPCCIHRASDHHMKDWPLHYRNDWGFFFERIDPEGVGHPDPDDLAFRIQNGAEDGIHSCNGLCNAENYEKYLKEHT